MVKRIYTASAKTYLKTHIVPPFYCGSLYGWAEVRLSDLCDLCNGKTWAGYSCSTPLAHTYEPKISGWIWLLIVPSALIVKCVIRWATWVETTVADVSIFLPMSWRWKREKVIPVTFLWCALGALVVAIKEVVVSRHWFLFVNSFLSLKKEHGESVGF